MWCVRRPLRARHASLGKLRIKPWLKIGQRLAQQNGWRGGGRGGDNTPGSRWNACKVGGRDGWGRYEGRAMFTQQHSALAQFMPWGSGVCGVWSGKHSSSLEGGGGEEVEEEERLRINDVEDNLPCLRDLWAGQFKGKRTQFNNSTMRREQMK